MDGNTMTVEQDELIETEAEMPDDGKVLLSIGMNKKLKAGGVAVFNLPAGVTCNALCPNCYAMKAQRMYKSAKLKREWNLEQSKKPGFALRMSAEIEARVKGIYKVVRWHESGDFYSQKYINDIAYVVSRNPEIRFYAYTKRLKDFDFSKLKELPNMTIINSMKFGRNNYGTIAEIQPMIDKGAFLCPANGGKASCGNGCDYCFYKKAADTGVVFLKH